SDKADSFKPLKDWLVSRGHPTQDIYLGNYESMEDHVTFDDLADGLQTRLATLQEQGKLTLAPFSLDVIVHSTGGPVIRHWPSHYVRDICGTNHARCPIARLIMLAPANFGSRLAAQGKSALAKIFRGGVSNGFMTGRKILEGLELGSPILWQMAENDLFCGEAVYPVEDRGPWVFIFSGTNTYGHLKGFVAKGAAEDGSDGTIRAAAAALDSVLFRVDYAVPADLQPNGKGKSNGRKIVSADCSRSRPVAFRLVEGVNHSEIVPQNHTAPILPLVEQCLAVNSTSDYEKLRAEFVEANAAFYREQAKLPLGADDRVHKYQQFIVRVRDDMGNEVDDYRLDFHVVDDNIVGSVWNAHDKEDDTLTRLKRYQSLTQRLNEEVVVDVVPHSV